MSTGMNRREAIQRLGATAIVAAFHPAIPRQGPAWTPAFLEATEVETVADLAERIIPETDTPGAGRALVHQYIDFVLSEAKADAQSKFREGLRSLDEKCGSLFGKRFVELEPSRKDEVLTSLSEEPFFKEAKRLTIDGYYRSEIGMKQELGFEGNAFLSEFEGCNHEEHRTWTPKD